MAEAFDWSRRSFAPASFGGWQERRLVEDEWGWSLDEREKGKKEALVNGNGHGKGTLLRRPEAEGN